MPPSWHCHPSSSIAPGLSGKLPPSRRACILGLGLTLGWALWPVPGARAAATRALGVDYFQSCMGPDFDYGNLLYFGNGAVYPLWLYQHAPVVIDEAGPGLGVVSGNTNCMEFQYLGCPAGTTSHYHDPNHGELCVLPPGTFAKQLGGASGGGKPSSNSCTNAGGGYVGDPVGVATGNVYAVQTDWEPNGWEQDGLALHRSYNSAYSSTASANGHGLAGLLGPFGLNWSFRYGARLLPHSATPLSSVQALRPDGQVLTFGGSAGAGWSSDADVNATLTESSDGSGRPTGWTLRLDDDSTERYDAEGRLLAIRARSGLTRTLSYSDDTTPAAVAPAPGLLIGVADAFGRQLRFTYNAKTRIRTLTTPDGAVTRYAYDNDGNLLQVAYPDGSAVRYVYQAGSLLTRIVDENGSAYATYAYDADARASRAELAGGAQRLELSYGGGVTTVTGALGAVSAYSYQDLLGQLRNTRIQTPCLGCSTPTNSLAMAYNAHGYVSGYTDTPGDTSSPQSTAFTWDTGRNLMRTRTDAAGTSVARTISATWHPSYRLPETITAGHLTTAYTYDDQGRIIRLVQTDTASHRSRTITARYDESGTVPGAVLRRVVTGPRTDLEQTTTTLFYPPDATCPGSSAPLGCRGQVHSVTNALGQVTQVNAYNAAGRPLRITDPDGLVIGLGYDRRNRLTRLQVGAEATAYQYDAAGDLIRMTRPDGSVLRLGYDVAHRLMRITLEDGSHIAYTRDAYGDITREQVLDASGSVTYTHGRVYDILGRLIQDVGAVNQTSTRTHDAHGNVDTLRGPRTDLGDVTRYEYDPLDRLTRITQADGGVQQMAYDPLGHLTRLTDANDQLTRYTPDAWGDALQTISPDTGTTSRTFDAAGNLLSSTDAMGQVTSYTYDALNRVLGKSSSVPGTPAYTFAYDNCPHGVGRLCTVEADGVPAIALRYDSQQRLASRTDTVAATAWTTAYRYHPGGALASLRYPSGQTVHYAVDSQGRVSQVSVQPADGAAPIVLASRFTYHPFAGPAGFTFGNGAAYLQALDQDGQPTVQQSGPWGKSATYDQAGNLHTLTDADGTLQSYGYDVMQRLAAASDTASPGYGTRAYRYDRNGNRTSVSRNGATDRYTYSPPNWLAATRASRRTRNPDGDLVNLGTLGTLKYDGYERLQAIDPPIDQATHQATRSGPNAPGDPYVRYAYNAFNTRTCKKLHGRLTRFVYGQDQQLLLEQAAGGPEQDYVYLDGRLLARLDSTPGGAPTVVYFHTDALGTPQAMTDAGGQVVWQATYTPFGTATLTRQSMVNHLRFPGQYFDEETQFAYNVHRHYDATTGRYLQADPVGLAAGMNLYAYVGGESAQSHRPFGPRLAGFSRCLGHALWSDPWRRRWGLGWPFD